MRIKRPGVYQLGQSVGQGPPVQRLSVKDNLVGKSNEVEICIEGITVSLSALLEWTQAQPYRQSVTSFIVRTCPTYLLSIWKIFST